MAGRFELYKDKQGKFRFCLKASNGQIILASQGYTAKPSAKNGIESVKKNAPDETRFESKETQGGLFRFNLKSKNARVIATSESYKTKKAQDNVIASTRKNAPSAKIIDLTV